jgi:antitoxin Phd
MLLDSKKIVGISEVNQNFSKIAKMVDDNKMITIMKNNKPKYVMIAYEEFEKNSKNDEELDDIANRILQKNIEDFKELAE